MRKEVTIVRVICDWCKKMCHESEMVFDKYDLCLACKVEMIERLAGGNEAQEVMEPHIVSVTEEPKKRGRKKKEEVVEVTTIAKDLGLDMRVSNDANRLEKAIAVAGDEATKEEIVAAIERVPEYFSDTADHKALLREYLEEKGFDFTSEADRARAMNIKIDLISCRIDIKNLKAWLDENVECNEIDLPF